MVPNNRSFIKRIFWRNDHYGPPRGRPNFVLISLRLSTIKHDIIWLENACIAKYDKISKNGTSKLCTVSEEKRHIMISVQLVELWSTLERWRWQHIHWAPESRRQTRVSLLTSVRIRPSLKLNFGRLIKNHQLPILILHNPRVCNHCWIFAQDCYMWRADRLLDSFIWRLFPI